MHGAEMPEEPFLRRLIVVRRDGQQRILNNQQKLLDLYERVQSLDAEAARSFVFSTGGVAPELQGRLRATGVRCLDKPCDTAELRDLLAR